MTRFLKPLAILTAIVASIFVVNSRSEARSSRLTSESDQNFLVTLYKLDPISKTFSFRDGKYGGLFQDHMAKNRQSYIDFGNYHKGEFTVGIEGGTKGVIMDLRHTYDLGQRHGFPETVGGGQGFSSIRFKDKNWSFSRITRAKRHSYS